MTLNYLGYMLADKGIRLPEALKLIRKAVELEPMNGAYLDSLGWAYFKLGSTSWPKRICARLSSATRPTPRSTIISAICTRRPGASGWQPRNGSFRSPIFQVAHRRRGAGRSGQGSAQAGDGPREAGQAGKCGWGFQA